MVEEVQAPVIPAAAPAAEAPAPSVPVDSPSSVEPSGAPLAIETPVAETPVPAAENILGDAAPEKKEVVAGKEAPTEAATEKTATETPAETKVEFPTYEEFKLPEGTSLDKEPLEAFTKILGEVETGKLDHKGFQEVGQKLIDLAAKNTVESINRLNDYYVNFHENQKKEWFESFKKDPEMGGTKLNETVGLLRDAVEQYAGTEAQITEFRQLMKETGVGNHPALTRLLYNMQQKINKYTTETGGNRIVPANAPAPSKVKPYQQFYQGGS